MDEFKVEYFVASGNDKISLSSLEKNDREQWQKDLEAQALNKFYNKKVKIIRKKLISRSGSVKIFL